MIPRLLKKILFATITVILSLVAADLLLGAAAYFSPRVDDVLTVVDKYIPDERLGHRPNPAYPDHDANGFRNRQVPETAQIVALGDSQTYGNGVEASESWPNLLQEWSGRSVYSLAFGGYGPIHSLLLWEQAVALKPEIVIDALYSGNDLNDAFNMVYVREQMPEFLSDDPGVLETIRQAQEDSPLNRRISKASKSKKKVSAFEKFRKSIKPWFEENSNVYGLLWRAKYELERVRDSNEDDDERWRSAKASADRRPEKTQAFSSGSSRTVFESKYRLTALDLDDPTIREGQRISLEAMREMHERASRDGIRFIVLLIPTKELVFYEQAKDLDAENYQKLVRHERQFWKTATDYFDAHSIEYADSLPSLRAALDAGSQPYRVTGNGHPNENGYRAIAQAIHAYLDSRR